MYNFYFESAANFNKFKEIVQNKLFSKGGSKDIGLYKPSIEDSKHLYT